jgi:hypothetical protein
MACPHPERDTIARRYLRHQRTLVDDAIERLTAEDEIVPVDEEEAAKDEIQLEQRLSLNEQRLATVLAVLKEAVLRESLISDAEKESCSRCYWTTGNSLRLPGWTSCIELSRRRKSVCGGPHARSNESASVSCMGH